MTNVRSYLLVKGLAQKLGMASDLYATYPVVKETFDTANRIFGYDLRELIDSNEENLNPDTTSTSYFDNVSSHLSPLAENGITPYVAAGLSLGNTLPWLRLEFFHLKI